MKNDRGFTLVEVLVAMAVLGIACVALFSLLSRSMFNLRKLEDLHHYELACEDVMNRVQLLSRLPPEAQLTGKVADSSADWRISVTPWYPANLISHPGQAIMKIDVNVSWTGRAGLRTLRLESVKMATIAYDNNYDFGQAIDKVFPR
jgi:general secretion pathway protein I